MTGSRTLSVGVAAAVAPVCAMAPEAAADTLYTQSDLIAPVTSTQFVALVHASVHRPPLVQSAWGSRGLPAGPVETDVAIDSPPGFDSYSLIGLDAAGGVFVSFVDPSSVLGQPFSTVFPGFDEGQVASAILTSGPLLTSFISELDKMPNVAAPMGVQSQAVDFSNGADYGTFVADFQPVPAPGVATVVIFGGVGALLRRGRRGTARGRAASAAVFTG